ncbi:MAG: enolase C-terminal domain-like protein, partial [Candidatus Hadarchaeales archaeon]
MRIEEVKGRKILDSRGDLTVEVEVKGGGGVGRGSAPSGKSRGKYEAVAFPSGGVDASLSLLKKELSPKLVGMELDFRKVDAFLREVDGTNNFSRIGGNLAVALSFAVAKAEASAKGLSLHLLLGKKTTLPLPLGNVLGGGAHAEGGRLDLQELLVIPVGARSFQEAAFTNARVHRKVGELLKKKGRFVGGKGDEGAWISPWGSEESLNVVREACEEVEGETGVKMRMGVDMAAGYLYDPKEERYVYPKEGRKLTKEEQMEFAIELVENYDLLYLEDPLCEEDFQGFSTLLRKVGKKCLVCGDDLFATNVERIEKGIEKKAMNAVLIKPNQVGTLSETLEAIELVQERKLVPVVSHRSGETTDETIAHLAVGKGCPLIKTGAVG